MAGSAIKAFCKGDWHGAAKSIRAARTARAAKLSETFKVELNVPIPPKNCGSRAVTGAGLVLKSLRRMESVWLPMPAHKATRLAWHYIGSGSYITRAVNGGARVWRIK